jgi:hypothetical protein
MNETPPVTKEMLVRPGLEVFKMTLIMHILGIVWQKNVTGVTAVDPSNTEEL